MANAQSLHVPQAKSSISTQSVRDIMAAYNTQSKIQLYGDDSAQSANAQNESIGVTGKDIPLSMLRPRTPQMTMNENGQPVMAKPSRNRIAQEVAAYGNIANAYKQMNGITENEDDDMLYEQPNQPANLSQIKKFQASYVEDMPDTDEGLLEILKLTIDNAKANLEMLQSLYAALSGSDLNDGNDNIETNEDDFIEEPNEEPFDI